MSPLLRSYQSLRPEAGVDEAGRGCLAGPVVAAAVVLNDFMDIEGLDDSKKIAPKKRESLRCIIEENCLFGIGMASVEEIDEINILNASFLAMHRAIENLSIQPQFLLIDGNRFKKFKSLEHICITKGDAKYQSIAAASILAKTHRDELMRALDPSYPKYGWKYNKGYPTPRHKKAILEFGNSPHHRKSFRIREQLRLF